MRDLLLFAFGIFGINFVSTLNIDEVVQIIVQLAIGIATVYSILRNNKKQKDKE